MDSCLHVLHLFFCRHWRFAVRLNRRRARSTKEIKTLYRITLYSFFTYLLIMYHKSTNIGSIMRHVMSQSGIRSVSPINIITWLPGPEPQQSSSSNSALHPSKQIIINNTIPKTINLPTLQQLVQI